MIPVLFNENATSFNTNGIGRLIDTLSCEVLEKRNGEYSLELIYPTSGQFYDEIKTSRFIVVKVNDTDNYQAFRIDKISKPINQLITIKANHLSYDLNFIPVSIFNAVGINAALNGLKTNSLENNPFNFITDINNTDTLFKVDVPKSVRACLGGTEGSILQTFSGSAGVEYKWDNFDVYVTLHRGSDNGVELRYGKNIIDLNYIENIEETITGVLPVWTNPEGTSTLTGDIQYSPYKNNYPFNRTVVLDCSEHFETAPTLQQLNSYAFEYVSLQGLPKENIKVSFVDLSQTEEYKFSVGVESINLCDEITVIYQPLNISFKAKIIETLYDVLSEKYISLTIGDAKSSLAQTLITTIEQVNNTSDKLASVNIKVNQQDATLTTVAQQVEGQESQISQIQQTAENIITQVAQTYYTKSEAQELEHTISTQFSQTNESFEMRFDEVAQDLQNVQTSTDAEFQNISKYIRFIDGNIILGEEGNLLTLRIENDKISFLENDIEIAYWQNRKFYAVDGEFINSLKLGNFAFIPRANGNLSFKKVGG